MEDYKDCMVDWVKKVEPFIKYSDVRAYDWDVTFISQEYAKIFLPLMKEELCLFYLYPSEMGVDWTHYRFFRGVQEYYFDRDVRKDTDIDKDTNIISCSWIYRNYKTLIDDWFAKYYPGVDPWEKP